MGVGLIPASASLGTSKKDAVTTRSTLLNESAFMTVCERQVYRRSDVWSPVPVRIIFRATLTLVQ
jgi:hypothetical protein